MVKINSALHIVVIGFGSIGRRHISNLLKRKDISKITIITSIPPEKCKETLLANSEPSANKITIEVKNKFSDNDIKTAHIALITNETHKHAYTSIRCIRAGIRNIFIEKPLASSVKDALTLKKIASSRMANIGVGYNLRFLGAINKIRQLLGRGTIGKPYFARIEVGQYLPQWRPGVDYTRTYSANKYKGGGVALDLSHEVDYMRFLFGQPVKWKILKTKTSDLKINSDDLFEGTYLFRDGFLCNVHCDYLQRIKKRSLRIVGSEGEILCDMIEQKILILKNNSAPRIIRGNKLFDISATYMDELSTFIKPTPETRKIMADIDDGIEALRLVISDGEI